MMSVPRVGLGRRGHLLFASFELQDLGRFSVGESVDLNGQR